MAPYRKSSSAASSGNKKRGGYGYGNSRGGRMRLYSSKKKLDEAPDYAEDLEEKVSRERGGRGDDARGYALGDEEGGDHKSAAMNTASIVRRMKTKQPRDRNRRSFGGGDRSIASTTGTRPGAATSFQDQACHHSASSKFASSSGSSVSGTISTVHSSSAITSQQRQHQQSQQQSRQQHVVCAVSENLARETCLTCIDACLPTELHVTKQGNGNTYGETLAALEWIKPDEILLNEGRQHSQLIQKIMALYKTTEDDAESEEDDHNAVSAYASFRGRGGTAKTRRTQKRKNNRRRNVKGGGARILPGATPSTTTVVKLVPRHYFDQTKGGELVQTICRADQQHIPLSPLVMEEYILLASAHAAIHYSSMCLGVTFAPKSVLLHINNPHHTAGNNHNSNGDTFQYHRMSIDRNTLLQMELLSNARTGSSKHSLIGTIDCCKTTVGSRLLRRTLMAPPNRASTIEARLDLVQSLLGDEDFFYSVMEHLEALPELDRMMSHMALVPKLPMNTKSGKQNGTSKRATVVTAKMASRGISALVCIKTTLSVIPTFAEGLERKIKLMEEDNSRERGAGDDDDDGGSQRRRRRRKPNNDKSMLGDEEVQETNALPSGEGEVNDDDDDDATYVVDDDGTVTTGFFTSMGELTVVPSPSSKRRASRSNDGDRHNNDSGTSPKSSNDSCANPPPARSLLLRAILHNMRQPALTEILDCIEEIFTESTTYSRNAHAMRHQECFALKPNTDGMMDILRKAFLANIDDIFRLADEYSQQYDGMTVAVRETSTRGYYLSIPESYISELPPIFIQPVKNGRFIQCTTEEVHSLNARAQENVQDLLLITHGKIQEVMDEARARFDSLASLCDAIALLDMIHCFADNVASSRLPWCRPVMTDSIVSDDDHHHHPPSRLGPQQNQHTAYSGGLAIRNGRYAINVMAAAGLSSSSSSVMGGSGEFVPNDSFAAPYQNFTVITGINGSGKSTYLKQIAITAILAHCGSYVPAEEAYIPLFDKLLTRIGTSDDQQHNISTFLLEMRDTAAICDQATDKSLILMDELGRATSNEDGVAIAWAVSEFLLVKRSITFFVTHYPQLSKLADVYHNVQNQHLGTSTVGSGENEEVAFTHKIQSGPCITAADYGVEMAGTCGWPIDVMRDVSSGQSAFSAHSKR
jgi:DNA mismatch repair ATPase MutS